MRIKGLAKPTYEATLQYSLISIYISMLSSITSLLELTAKENQNIISLQEITPEINIK